MARCKRGFCIFFAALFLVLAPSRSYAASATVVAAGTYATKCLLAACGVAGGTAMLAALIGTWEDEDTYALLGAQKKLGSYAQKIYDGARDSASERQEYYQELEETLISLITSTWGDTVSGIASLAGELKEFLKYCYGYGYSGVSWAVPVVPVNQIWGETQWSSLDFYPLPTGPVTAVPSIAYNSNYTLFLSVFLPSSFAGVMNILNLYYYNTTDVFGIYDAASSTLNTYQRNATNSTYADYSIYAYSAYLYEDGTFKYSTSSTSYWKTHSFFVNQRMPDCSPSLSFLT